MVIKFLTLDSGERSDAGDKQLNAVEFRRGRTSLLGDDLGQDVRPSDAVCEENSQAVQNIVMQNRRVNVYKIADTVGISIGPVKTILHERLFMRKVCARWVPECSKNDQK